MVISYYTTSYPHLYGPKDAPTKTIWENFLRKHCSPYEIKFQKLPDELCEISSLKKLRIDQLLIKSLPENIDQLKNLTHLSVTNSPLLKLPDAIGNFQNIQEINLEETFVSEFPHTMFLKTKKPIHITVPYLFKFPYDLDYIPQWISRIHQKTSIVKVSYNRMGEKGHQFADENKLKRYENLLGIKLDQFRRKNY